MYGDTYYKYITSGSTATSAATSHKLLGAYDGLSLLNTRDVVHMQIFANGDTAIIGPSGSISNNIGFHLSPSASMVDFPPMNVGAVNDLHLFRSGSTDVSVTWTLWRRV